MPTRRSAHAKVTVNEARSTPYDRGDGPELVELALQETFTGDMDGESTVRALQARSGDGSATMLSMQRFDGQLGGRRGTFVLQGSAVVEGDRIKATWFVVPGSGTGELAGLRGDGGFGGAFGQGSDATLDYRFE